ncbi:MAG: hypothetical protein PHW65_00010, partial [Dehalococcoidales bacterium]|nr:hypothetical protein [Dehalococcoidales bacterium]
MKKSLSSLLLCVLTAISANAIVIENTNTVHLVLADVCDGSFSDFKFQISGYDSQRFVFNYDRDVSDSSFKFRINKPIEGTIYYDVSAGDITCASTSVTFTISRTNIPPPGTYYGELLAFDTATTNVYRSIAQGTLPVTWSLYLNETNYFQRSTTNASVGQVYVHPNWVDPPWLSTSDAPSTIYYTIIKGNTLSSYVDSVYAFVTNIQANTSTYQTAASSMTNWTAVDSQSNYLYYSGRTLTGSVTNAYDLHWRSVSNDVVSNSTLGATAYGWGDHSSAGYLTATSGIYATLTIGDRSKLTTNLSDMTSTYT